MNIDRYIVLLKRLLLSIFILFFLRLLFIFFNLTDFQGFEFIKILKAVLHGLRFDLSTVLIFNSIFIILSTLPIHNRIFDKILKIVFLLSNFFIVSLNIIDYEFYKFNGKKISIDLLGIPSDIKDQIFQISIYYWYFPVLILIFTFCIHYFYPKIDPNKFKYSKVRLLWTPILSLLIIIITFIGIRGGLQLRSMSPKQAYIFEDYELGHISINSAYTFIRSVNKPSLKKISYFEDGEAIRIIQNINSSVSNFEGISNSNVVIIILESFSQEYVDLGYAPFLSELSQKSLYLDKNFANGRRSIQALPSIMVGLPSLIDKPIYQSQFQTNRYFSLANILKNKGYSTSFYHGGKTGTMDFDAYTLSIGFDEYYGMEDYPNKNDYDGFWGIFDHKFINWFGMKLQQTKQPFFSAIFTLSSHQPYSIPRSFKGIYPKGNLEIHESIGYVDNSIKLFFQKYNEMEWFKNTLFVITADHTQKLESKKFNNTLGKYRVPLIFYHPKFKDFKKYENKVSQHADILPSVLDFLNIKQGKSLLYGKSIFSANSSPVINYINGKYSLYYKDEVVSGSKNQFTVHRVIDSTLEKKTTVPIDEKLLKAYIQYTINGLIENNLYR